MTFSLLIHRRLSSRSYNHKFITVFSLYLSPHNPNSPNYSSLSSPETEIKPKSPPPTTSSTSNQAKPTSLSARMSFVFDQIDAIEKERSQKDETLQRIRTWRESKNKQKSENDVNSAVLSSGSKEKVEEMKESGGGSTNKAVELVHPWPEWIELMERLVQQNYFDHKRKDEDKMIEDLGFKMEQVADEVFDFTRDWRTVQTACLNFGKDRFDILRSLSRHDIQVLVGHGCPSIDKKVVFSAKLLRKHAHLDEGDVCSSCNLRSSCERGYLLTNKEDEARTIDVMRVLLTYGFDPVNGSVMNESLLKIKSVKTVVRKLLHQVVKLSAVPIDPNLPPPVIKKPPPKVKQPPPPPRRRVGRDDIEMKKGDWLCPKCDFMNFAKNSVCLQCDSNRPKRQLLPGEWECPECNFLNYRRNVVCFHCECKRPPDEYMENQMQDKQHGPRTKLEKISARKDSWNFDFDDNESDGADVAAFEYADSHKMNEDFPESRWTEENSRRSEEGLRTSDRPTRAHEREYSDLGPKQSTTGFDDFDDEEDDLESYEIDTQSRDQGQRTASINLSELEVDSDSDDSKDTNDRWNSTKRSSSPRNSKAPKRMHGNAGFSGSDVDELDFDSHKDMPVHPNWKSSHVANPQQRLGGRAAKTFDSDDDVGLSSDSENDEDLWSKSKKGNKWDSNRKDVGRRAGHSSEDFSGLDSDGEDVRSHRDKGPKASFDRRRNVLRGRAGFDGSGRSGFKSRSMTDDRKSPSRDKFERSSGGSRGNGRVSGRDDYSGRRKGGDEYGGGRKRFGGDDYDGGRKRFGGDDYDGSRKRFSGDDYDGGRKRFGGDDYDGRRKSSGGGDSRNYKNPKRESFGKQRGRFSNSGSRPTAGSDSFFEDERYNRPRNNVR